MKNKMLNMVPAIELSDVKKAFQVADEEFVVLRDIDLIISKGEFVSIVGQSGSGKSTLLYLIGSIDAPTSGSIKILGNDIISMTDKEKSNLRRNTVSIVYQFYNLIPEFTALQNVLLPIMLNRKSTKKYINKANDLLDLVGLKDKKSSFPNELSGGQQQRVAIARALMNDSDIILADEPTGNLDSKSGEEIMNLFVKINKDISKTIVMVTHSERIAKYSKRQIAIEDGRILHDQELG